MKHNNLPLVSIGIPTYNRQKYLPQAINSLRKQTYKNIEIIIGDNCSTDNTKEISLKLTQKDKRIKYFHLQKHTVSYPNFMLVLDKAHGKYFMWASDDDLWDKNFVSSIVTELEKHSNAVMGVSDVKLFTDKTTRFHRLSTLESHELSTQAIKKFLLHPEYCASMLYAVFKTSVIKKHKLHRDWRPLFGGLSESVSFIRILLNGDLVHVKKPLFAKRDTGYYFTIRKELQSLNFSTSIISAVKRYLLFPSIYILDFYYSVTSILNSNKLVTEKLSLTLYCIIKLVRDGYSFLREILFGIVAVLKGLGQITIRRIFSR